VRLKSLVVPIVIGCGVPLVLAGCGSSSSGSGPASGSLPAMKIMVTGTFHSQALNFPEAVDGAQAAAKALNAAGGLDGQKIQIISCDDKLDPNVAAQCARKAVQDKVVGVVFGIDNMFPSELPIFEQAKIPLLAPTEVGTAILKAPTAFPVESPDSWLAQGEYAAQHGCKKVADVVFNEPSALTVVNQFDAGMAAYGGKPVTRKLTSFSVPDYSSVIASADSSGAQCLTLAIAPTEILKALNAVHQSADPKIQIYGSAGSFTSATIKGLGSTVNGLNLNQGTYSPSAVPPFDSELAAYSKSAAVSPYSLSAWEGMQLLKAAAPKISGGYTAAKLVAALNATSNISIASLPVSIDFTKTGAIASAPRAVNATSVLYSIENGGVKIIAKQSVAPAVANTYYSSKAAGY
jgi:ABC-type branched-subunit amino acid transport system substrate-binding protein